MSGVWKNNMSQTRFALAIAAAILSVIMVSCGASAPAYAAEGSTEVVRNAALIREFKENNTCPSTGRVAVKGVEASYKCPGYVVDHGIPFCAGKYIGRDVDQAHNLFYQKHDKANSLRKDSDERKLCATLKKLTNN